MRLLGTMGSSLIDSVMLLLARQSASVFTVLSPPFENEE
tara:strand:- start:1298 stop:1414 length:117 start_codon:yes stop_codon:yes gene_type:complete